MKKGFFGDKYKKGRINSTLFEFNNHHQLKETVVVI